MKAPVCDFCEGVHYNYMCRLNPKNICKYCGVPGHTSLMCFNKPRLPAGESFIRATLPRRTTQLRPESKGHLAKRMATSVQWFHENPGPDYICYLQINVNCPKLLMRPTVTLEHVRSKTRYPSLRYHTLNIWPACGHCNKDKRSLDLEELVQLPPDRRAMLIALRDVAISPVEVRELAT